MDHVAILRKARISKNDNLLGDILIGKKKIESRWYVNKISPWNQLNVGDHVYFKESGCSVTAVAVVSDVLQFENLTKESIKEILQKYGSKIAPGTTDEKLQKWGDKLINKRYCILVFLENVQKLEPFEINKKGYGISSAWLCVGKIESVRISSTSPQTTS
ncbi:hypothetical protein A2415_01060 [candidate division WWE3 bacterium RIFOXYC1_FULL_39_7]|uniref:ASCH domain-containing protein n=2 Tax=Katanobacteria TaxID=422282 RepID=A0A1F4X335_UNCKA|nr:MAG: hypothetical protein A2415_01060 [candidate division WWE3 bacterium RIFOXYC1_FULL_39_7]OGC76120.1 MAG: hypothetical protein A2619_02050 [candidate division WWE3 bacterium RIFOXYD1_FULL_39_9]